MERLKLAGYVYREDTVNAAICYYWTLTELSSNRHCISVKEKFVPGWAGPRKIGMTWTWKY
jgi:hypothetical protein